MKQSSVELSAGVFVLLGLAAVAWFAIQAGARIPLTGSTYAVELNGPYQAAGTDYDQTNVTGAVSLGGATLSLSGGAATPASSLVLTILGLLVLAATTPGPDRRGRWLWTVLSLLPVAGLGLVYLRQMRAGGAIATALVNPEHEANRRSRRLQPLTASA